MTRRLLSGLGAVAILAVLLVGVPFGLVAVVGNPWPGRAALEVRDQGPILVGVLAALAWLVWARFAIAVAIEIPRQWRDAVADLRSPSGGPERPEIRPPAASGPGLGMLAARLVAAALVLLPLVVRSSPVSAGPQSLSAGRAVAAVVDEALAWAPRATVPAAPRLATAARSVRVEAGDTLFGLARQELGDATRWREIFELNRDRPQQGGHRLTSPSVLEPGWTLFLPDGGTPEGIEEVVPEPPAYVAPTTVVVEPGDNLWDLTHDRLAAAGLDHDDAAVLDQLGAVVEANADEVADPNVIFVGQSIDLPAIGVPPLPPPPPPASLPPPIGADAVPGPAPDTTVASAPPGPPVSAPVSTSAGATTTTTSDPPPAVPAGPDDGRVAAEPSADAPAPIGLSDAALLSTGLLALLVARRRRRLRSSRPRARLPEPSPEHVATERTLRSVDGTERLHRLDVAVRAAAATLVEGRAQPALMRVGPDGTVELALTAAAELPPPWRSGAGRWLLLGRVPIELVADEARRVGAPCVALIQLGVDTEGYEVFADLEALGVLAVDAPEAEAEAVIRGIAATLATAAFAEPAHLIGVALDEVAFFGHASAHRCDTVDQALELAATLVGTTAAARQSTFALRARHTSGESWEPAVVVVGAGAAPEVSGEIVTGLAGRRAGVALVASGEIPGSPWQLRQREGRWTLLPIGIDLTPIALSGEELVAVHDVLQEATIPLVDDDLPVLASASASAVEPPWSLLVRVLGPVSVIDRDGREVEFSRSKTLELIAWLALHRERSTRAAARTALWDLAVRDSTFANVVSEARRALARAVAPPEGEEWLERTLTERLPLHAGVVTDADLVRSRLDLARLEPPQQAIETLRPAVELIRDHPFAGTGYLWPDPEGIASNLVLLATSAATELAGHYLSLGDVDGLFWATGQGLKVLPGHEELIALRMRAHHRTGDLAGVRLEWECYERVIDGDPWSDGEPAPKLVQLRQELLRAAPT